jgi:hypothetical protein
MAVRLLVLHADRPAFTHRRFLILISLEAETTQRQKCGWDSLGNSV